MHLERIQLSCNVSSFGLIMHGSYRSIMLNKCGYSDLNEFDIKMMVESYSHLFNKRGGWNKRGRGAKVAKSLIVPERLS